MSYQADHLAWQQRVQQEFKAQNAEQETTHMFEKNGQWYNYPDLVEYLRNQSFDPTNIKRMARPFGSNYGLQVPGTVPMMNFVEGSQAENKLLTRDSLINSAKRSNSQQHRIGQEISSQYGYAPKSKVIYQRGLDAKSSKSSVRSKMGSQVGPYIPEADTKSQLSKANVQRFNEAPASTGARSQVGSKHSVFSKPKSQILSKVGSRAPSKKSVFSTASKAQAAAVAAQWETKNIEDQEVAVVENAGEQQAYEEPQAPYEEQEPVDLDEAEDIVTSVSQIKPTASQLSKMSGKTYISQLQKQLEAEKYAREDLEAELTQLKEISQEISSQLSNLQKNAEK